MKKIYLYVIAISLLSIGCSSDDLMIEERTPQTTNSISEESSLVNLIIELTDNCKDIETVKGEELISLIEQKAFKNLEFQELARRNYTTPIYEDLEYMLTTSTENIISEMDYSPLVKNYLQAMIIDQHIFSENFFKNSLLEKEEKQLLETCNLLNDGHPEDDRNDIKTISFAYGYQTSPANAVLMAVLMSFY